MFKKESHNNDEMYFCFILSLTKRLFNDCSGQFGCFYITVAIVLGLLNVVIGSEASHFVFWEDFMAQPGRVILYILLLNCFAHSCSALSYPLSPKPPFQINIQPQISLWSCIMLSFCSKEERRLRLLSNWD